MFVLPASSESVPSAYVFCDVHDNRLSPWRNQRSSCVKMENLAPASVCFFCENFMPADSTEMRVVCGSPRKNAMLLLKPPLTPVDGFDPIDGATTRKCARDSSSSSSACSVGSLCRS